MKQVYIPETNQKRIVIIGGGFAGLAFAKELSNKNYQIILLDKNNFHQFQPLFYQVSTSSLEPDAISFSLRKIFRKANNVFFRMADVQRISTEKNEIYSDIGMISYDYLVLATGTTNNFYGLEDVEEHAFGFKSIQEALDIRSAILENLERASNTNDPTTKEQYTNIVVCGGGPAGVEMAGAFAEFKQFIFQGDYKDMNPDLFKIYLVEAAPRLLLAMSEKSATDALNVLEKLGVEVILDTAVKNYNGMQVTLADERVLEATNVIWTAGVKGNLPTGFNEETVERGNRLQVNDFLQVNGHENIFAIGDIAYMTEEKWEKGHPQVAPAAIQHGKHLAKNFLKEKKDWQPFSYHDKGALATIGKKNAVLDKNGTHIHGFIGWFIWATVHLFSISGFKNRIRVGINWMTSYFSYDKRNRLIIRKYYNK